TTTSSWCDHGLHQIQDGSCSPRWLHADPWNFWVLRPWSFSVTHADHFVNSIKPGRHAPIHESMDRKSVLDLMSPEGTFVRAAMKSLDRLGVGAGSGEDAIADAGYPGFLHAFNAVRDPEEWGGNRGPINDQVGTRYWEVVELRREGDFFRTGVCSYGSAIAVKTQDGYRSSGSKPIGSATWITFGPDPALAKDKQAVPPSNQRGPERAPVLDVFGSWVITDLNVLDAAKDLPQCMSTLAPGTPSDAPKDYVVQTEPPPTLPPSPGWPDA
ncbi:hypothetical protein, partial [Mycolicibacterium smegmatis]